MPIVRSLLLALFAVVAAAPPVRAHVASATVTLTGVLGAPAAAGGTATIELNDDFAIEYQVTVHDLSGPALLAHIHESPSEIGRAHV